MKKFSIVFFLILSSFFYSCGSKDKALFSSNSQKGPNVGVDNGGGGEKAKKYLHATRRKKVKFKNNKQFSSTKSRYGKTVNVKSKNKEPKKDDASGGRKSGKGRKK